MSSSKTGLAPYKTLNPGQHGLHQALHLSRGQCLRPCMRKVVEARSWSWDYMQVKGLSPCLGPSSPLISTSQCLITTPVPRSSISSSTPSSFFFIAYHPSFLIPRISADDKITISTCRKRFLPDTCLVIISSQIQ